MRRGGGLLRGRRDPFGRRGGLLSDAASAATSSRIASFAAADRGRVALDDVRQQREGAPLARLPWICRDAPAGGWVSAGVSSGLISSTHPAADIVHTIVRDAEDLLRQRPRQLLGA